MRLHAAIERSGEYGPSHGWEPRCGDGGQRPRHDGLYDRGTGRNAVCCRFTGWRPSCATIPSDDVDKINDLTSDLEDLKTTVEELQVDPPANVDAESLQAVKAALQQASDATDEIEDQQEEERDL